MKAPQIAEIANISPEIPISRQYWLVRTMGGDYYDDYYNEKYIAIGYDKISLRDIATATKQHVDPQKALAEIIGARYNIGADKKEEINASYAASQLLRFATQIKVGDVVIVPGRSQERYVAMGVVEKAIYEEEKIHAYYPNQCPLKKRIKVSWGNQYFRDRLNPQIQLMFNSRHIVSNVTHYAEYIDSTTNDFYKKGDTSYLVLRVKTKKDISGCDFFFIRDVFDILGEYIEETQENVDIQGINMKVCVQSPGDIILYALQPASLILFGLIMICINGGGIKVDKWGLDISTQGFIKSISEFLDRKRDREFNESLQKKMETLDIQNPEEFMKMLKEFKNPRKDY